MRQPRPTAARACPQRRSGRGSTAAATIGCGWHGPSCAVVRGRGALSAMQCMGTGVRARCGGRSDGWGGGRSDGWGGGQSGGLGGGCRSCRSFGLAF
eukprot:scaffold8770_cov62-Phaeocystis_antarctica.AAC.3